MKTNLLYLLAISLCMACQPNNAPQITKEQAATMQEPNVGQLIATITFEVKVDPKDFEDGIQPWVSVEKPELDLPNLLAKEEVVISQKSVSIVIDYPLTNAYQFELQSPNGFTREKLITEISKAYHRIYEEEEQSATVKTLPIEQRKIQNRNETNGKYGIWGHDMADLALSEIAVHQTPEGKIVLTLGLES